MYPINSNPDLGVMQELTIALRHFLTYFAWALVAAFAVTGACFCCGYAAREAWMKSRPSKRPRRTHSPTAEELNDAVELDGAVRREAELGIRQFEEYLAACTKQSGPPRLRKGDREPGAGAAP